MAQLRTTSPGQLTKYVAPLIDQLQAAIRNKTSVTWNNQKVIIANKPENGIALENFRKMATNRATEKDAYGVLLYTNQNKAVTMGSFEKPKTASVGNRGDIAEGIMGAAIAARFINKNKDIGVNDIKHVLRHMTKGRSPGKGQVMDTKYVSVNKDGHTVDDVRFYLSLADSNMNGLTDEKNWSTLSDLFMSGVKYANGNTVRAWSKLLYENNQKNHIEVLSDGLGNQTGTKVDVSVMVDGQKTDINISLKAGDVKQFGQVGGSEFEKQMKLWGDLCNISVKPIEKQYKDLLADKQVPKAVYMSYEYAGKQISMMLKTPKTKEKFLQDLGSGIEQYATLREENVTLVQMNSSEAKIYNFKDVYKAIAGLDLKVTIKDSAGKPKMLIQDKNNKNLLEIRVKAENKPNGEIYIRNYVEKGDLLGQLISIYA